LKPQGNDSQRTIFQHCIQVSYEKSRRRKKECGLIIIALVVMKSEFRLLAKMKKISKQCANPISTMILQKNSIDRRLCSYLYSWFLSIHCMGIRLITHSILSWNYVILGFNHSQSYAQVYLTRMHVIVLGTFGWRQCKSLSYGGCFL